MTHVMKTVLQALCVLVLVQVAQADAPKPGLLWHKTGLPAVFPLQVKTTAGQDYFLTLIEAQSGQDALGAYIEGGRFFKVLVPPGTYRLRFDTRGGAPTEASPHAFDLPEPLEFKIVDAGTKGGHTVDLTERDASGNVMAVVTARYRCNRSYTAQFPQPQPPFNDTDGYGTRLLPPGEVVHHPNARFDPELLTGREDPARPTDFAPYLSPAQTGTKLRPC